MRNNRKSARLKLLDRIEVYDARSNEVVGTMVDISTGGFKMLARKHMEQGEEHLLSIVLPTEKGNRKIVFKADVRWSGKDINRNMFAAGFYLVQIKAEDKLDIASYILNKLMPDNYDQTSND